MNNVSILNSKSNYRAFDREVCKSCAIQEIEKELVARKVNLLNNPSFRRYALSLLDRLNDIDPVIDTLTQGKTSLSDLTLISKDEALKETSELMSIRKAEIDSFLIESLKKRKITKFLPIQRSAINNGLLKNKNLLIISNTSSGKTLIAELAGISHTLNKKKFIFAVPLVALANTKYDDFKKFYGDRFQVGIRTGRSRIFDSSKEKKRFLRERFSVNNSDIIVATYEGLDLLIRGGQVNFNDIGCIVIDEIQSLEDPERGPTLDCLQAKIRYYSKNIQIIGLSATIGNPEQFAQELSFKLVSTEGRPTPLEQHVLISRSYQDKLKQINQLIRSELKITSTYGFRGQTIIFTNSRRKTSEIADFLRQSGMSNARSYHSGLSYSLRRRIEQEFSSGKCPAIVATYALGAGVDFPASQVIFESMMMGNQILSPNTFTQMVGRAGRLGKHDRGLAVLLCLGESISSTETKTEIEIAFELINSDLTPIEPDYNEDSSGEQIISLISTNRKMSPTKAKEIYNRMLGTSNYDFMQITNKLIQNSFINIITKNDRKYLALSKLGKASTISFFSPKKTIKVVNSLHKATQFLTIALEMYNPQNIYLSKKLHSYLEKTYHMRFSTRLINSPVLDVMNASLRGKEATELNKWCLNTFAKWTQFFFNCSCKDNPYCEHGTIQIGRQIVTERLTGKNINQISASMTQFELLVYPGDILSFLNGIIHELEGIQRIAAAINKKKVEKKIGILIGRIEIPN
jgi:helicase